MATGYESILDQGQPSYGSMLAQAPPTYTGVLDQRMKMLDQTSSGQAVDPKAVAAADQDAATIFSEGMKGLRRFGYSTIATGQAMTGTALAPLFPKVGGDLIQEGLRTMQGMPTSDQAAVPNWSDVHDFDSGAKYLAGSLGENLPGAALALTGTLVGHGLGRGAGAVAGLRGAALDAAANRASWAGGMSTMVPMFGGQTAMDIAQDPAAMANTTPTERLGASLVSGVGGAALQEAVPRLLVAPRFLGQAARIEPGLAAGLRNTALLTGEGAAGMYGAGAASNLVGQAALHYADPNTPIDLSAAHEAGLAGLAPGAVLGGLGGVAQAVHSNIAAGVDKVGEGVQAVKSKMPSFDDVLGHVLGALNDPEGAGKAMAGATLDGIAKAGEAAGVFKDYAGKGLGTAGDYLSKVYDDTTKFIGSKVKDSDLRDDFYKRAAELKTMTLPEWNILKRDISNAAGSTFGENLGAAATVGAQRAWEGAKTTAGWIKDAATGYYKGLVGDAEESGGKASISAPDADDRKTAMALLYATAPGLKDTVEKLATTRNDKRNLANLMHLAINDSSFLTSGEAGEGTITKSVAPKRGSSLTAETTTPMADTAYRGQLLQKWQDATGTDLRKVVEAIRANRNDVTFNEIAGDKASVVMNQLGINPEHHDDLLEMVRAANGADYDQLPPSQQRLLFSMAGKNEIKARGLYAALESSFDKGQMAMERQVGEAGRVKSQIPGLTEAMQTETTTGAAPTSDEAGAGTGAPRTEGAFDDQGHRMDAESQPRSPFDDEVFKRILTQRQYAQDPSTRLPVSLKATNADVHPAALAAAFGQRVGKEEWAPHKKGTLTWNKEGELRQTINPMSLANVVTDPRYRAQFEPHMAALDQRPGASVNEVKGQRFMSVLSELASQGLHINPEKLGLPADHPLVHVKVGMDLSKLRDDLVISRGKEGKNTLTWADVSGKKRQQTSMRLQEKRLDKLGGKYGQSWKTMRESGELVDRKITNIVYAREAGAGEGKPSLDALDAGVKKYHEALPEMRREQKLREKMQDIAHGAREAYTNGDITADQMHNLIAYYEGHDGTSLKDAMKTSSLFHETALNRKKIDTSKLARALYEHMTDVERAREGIESTMYGHGEEGSLQGTITRDYMEHKYSAAQKGQQERTRAQERAEKRGDVGADKVGTGEITPETKVTRYPEGVSGEEVKGMEGTGKEEAPMSPAAQEKRSAEVKTVSDRLNQMLEDKRTSLLSRAPELADRINSHIDDIQRKLAGAGDELSQRLLDKTPGALLNEYRPALVKRLQPLEDAVTKSKSVVKKPAVDEARTTPRGITAERYNEIRKSEPLDKVTFANKRLSKRSYSHDDLSKLVQGWSEKYLGGTKIDLHIYDKQDGDPRGFVEQKAGANTIFLAHKHPNQLAALGSAAHEFGHLMQYNHFNDASNETKKALFAAYNADVKALQGGKLTTEEAIQRFGNASDAVLRKGELNDPTKLAQDPDYATSFKEWFANQFSKMVTSGIDKSLSPQEKGFWRGLVRSAQKFFKEVVKKLTPNTAFEDWVKGLAESQDDVTKALAESAAPPPEKPPSPPPPPGPGEVPPGGGFPHDEAKQRFIDVVHGVMGDKKVQVLFDQKLTEGVKGTFFTRQEALDRLYKVRRPLADALIDARKNGDKTAIDKLTSKIDAIDAKEKDILMNTAVQGFIELAKGMEKTGGLAEHETLHAAFKIFLNAEERRILGQAFTEGLAGKRLREIFKDDPVVMARISGDNMSGEEAAAYAYQIWSQDPSQFQLGPKVNTVFQKMINFVRKLVGSLTLGEKAQMIMESLKSGRRYEENISPVQKILDKDTAWQERAQKMAQNIGGLLKQGYDIVLTPARERLIDTNNPALTQAAKLAYQATGEEGNEGGMTQRNRKEYKQQLNNLGTIFKDLKPEQLQALHQHMVLGTELTDSVVADRAKQLHDWYDKMYDYQTKAGVRLKDAGVNEDYYPLTWSPEKVLKNKQAFIDMLEQPKYANQMLSLKKTPNELYDSITSYIDRGEDLVNVMGANKEPLSESSKARTLGFIDKNDRLAFMDDDPIYTAHRYMKQAVRQAEFVRSYGMEGAKLDALKTEAKNVYGATPEQMALLNDYIDGTLGNKEVGMPRELKDLYGAMTVYQNYRLLPFSLFSSIIDPWGVAIRSNSAADAWHTFSYSIKNAFNDWKKDYPRDFWAKYAEDMGIIEHSGTTISAHNQFDGITLRGATKDLNDKLFKYNLLNGWVRNNTIMATKAGQRFIYRASEGDFGKHSERYMKELGLTKDDVVYDKTQNRLLLYKDELEMAGKSKAEAAALETKLGNALDQFVRQSMLTPSSAELPNWMSNPYMAPIAHLKQFVFSFEATILGRIKHEMKNDNYKPVALAAAYVPGMIAADFMKDMIAGAGSQPPYKKDWGFFDYFNDGVQRSGLLGSGQFFTSMQGDITRGGGGYESFAGPAAQQLQQGGKAFFSGDSTAIKNWMVKSLPLMPAYKQYLVTPEHTGGQGGGGGGGGGSSALGLVDDAVMAAAKSS